MHFLLFESIISCIGNRRVGRDRGRASPRRNDRSGSRNKELCRVRASPPCEEKNITIERKESLTVWSISGDRSIDR